MHLAWCIRIKDHLAYQPEVPIIIVWSGSDKSTDYGDSGQNRCTMRRIAD